MRVTVHGCGRVGLVAAACFAEAGGHIVCVDREQSLVEHLRAGRLHFHEPGLAELVSKGLKAGNLEFTSDPRLGIEHGDAQFIAVGTPPGDDLVQVHAVVDAVAQHMQGYRLVVCKSTVPVGTCARMATRIAGRLAERGVEHGFDVVSNPEFLSGGTGLADFKAARRIILGTDSDRAIDYLSRLYQPFLGDGCRLMVMDRESSELTKYAANAMLATRVTLMNELAALAECVGADIEQVRAGVGTDARIGPDYLRAGCGFGGSCLSKDTGELARIAAQHGRPTRVIEAVREVNERQKTLLCDKIQAHFGERLAGRRIALWGLSFKPGSDDMSEAPSLALIAFLLSKGASILAYDPVATEACKRLLGTRNGLDYAERALDALDGAHALAITTEWPEFAAFDPQVFRTRLSDAVIFDGRNLYDPDAMRRAGLLYFGVGRGGHAPVPRD